MRARCASDVRWRRIVPVRRELHNEPNKNERGPTSGRSTSYGSGHLTQPSVAPSAPFPVHSFVSRALDAASLHYRRPLVAFKVPGKYRYVEANNGFICFLRNSSRRLATTKTPSECLP